MAYVDVKPELLVWAADRAGGIEVLENRFPKLYEWISNKKQPTFKQLESFAKATSTPLGYFFLKEPPKEKLTIPHYRTVANKETDKPSTALIDTIHMMQRRQEWMRDYLIESGVDPLPFVGRTGLTVTPKQAASNIRNELGLQDGWASEKGTWEDALRNLIKRVENIGILVMINSVAGNNNHRKLNVHEFRGFVLIDEYAPLIFINGADGKAAQMFTLAHELAHIWYGASAIFDLEKLRAADDVIERACNLTAAEFLVPEEEFIKVWQDVAQDADRYQIIARHFKVSELVILRRAFDNDLISKNKYFEYYRQMSNRAKPRKNSQGNFYATQSLKLGRRFSQAVINNVKSGKLLYRDAYRLTGLYGETFEKFAEHIGEV